MKKTIQVCIYTVIICASAVPFLAFGDHIPPVPESNVDYVLDARLFLKHNRWTPMLELEGWWEYDPNQFYYRHMTVGTYYRISKHVKVGGFYRLQMGARHDDDWINLNPGWDWVDTRDRAEHVLILDVTPRFLMPFLPGKDWLFMFKTRYMYNTYNGDQTIKLRPAITYFLMPGRDPLINFSFNWELYLALNYSSSVLYSQWPYLEILYHVSPAIKLSANVGYRVTSWSTSQDVVDSGESPFEVKYKAFTIGAAVNFHFDI